MICLTGYQILVIYGLDERILLMNVRSNVYQSKVILWRSYLSPLLISQLQSGEPSANFVIKRSGASSNFRVLVDQPQASLMS